MHPVCTSIIFEYVLRIIIYEKIVSRTNTVDRRNSGKVCFLSPARSCAESKYFVTFQSKISICPSYSPSTGQHILVLPRCIAQFLYETSNDIYTTE